MVFFHLRKLVNPEKRKLIRYNRLLELAKIKPSDRILNVGVGEGLTFEHFNKENEIVGIDLFPKSKVNRPKFKYMQRKADKLPFKDKEFDVAISIGVLEHIHPEASLKTTCDEMQRVAKRWIMLVPSMFTPIEPHFSFPFFQLLPFGVQKWLTETFGLRYHGEHSHDHEEINYYTNRVWIKKFFPGSKFVVHRHIGPLITNLIVYGGEGITE